MSVPSKRLDRRPGNVSLLGNLALAWRYVWNESFKQKKNFAIGFTAVWLVVFSIVYVTLNTSILTTQILFVFLVTFSCCFFNSTLLMT